MEIEKYSALVSKHRGEVLEAERHIWGTPETGYREWETEKYLAEIFENAGCKLTRAGDVPGFYTDIETGRKGPRLLIMCELDALALPGHFEAKNGCAHACGHHAQCAAMVGLMLALREPGALDGLCGSIRLMAVPAEELIEIEYRETLRQRGIIRYFGGKPEFMRRGYMDGVDLAFLFHTMTGKTQMFNAHAGNNGCMAKTATFEGRASHAGGAPERGINALYAASQALSNINALRETFIDDNHIRVHPIMTCGGASVNIIPAQTQISSYVRGASMDSIADASRKVNRAIAAGALALGARVQITDRPGYAPLNNCRALAALAVECVGALVGAENVKLTDYWDSSSTDIGDLSCVMPVLHPHIGGATGTAHGQDYRIEDPDLACVVSAKSQLLLAAELLCDGAAKAKKIISEYKPLYLSKEAYFAALDRFYADTDAVSYTETGAQIAF